MDRCLPIVRLIVWASFDVDVVREKSAHGEYILSLRFRVSGNFCCHTLLRRNSRYLSPRYQRFIMRDVTFTYELPSNDLEVQCVGQSIEITLSVDMQLGIGGDTWPAAELFCHLLLSPSWHSFFQKLFHQKTVIELGSGHGLAGILVDKIFNVQSVVITDLQNYVDLIDKNIHRNLCTHSRADAMDWTVYNSVAPDFSQEEKFDIVLALEW